MNRVLRIGTRDSPLAGWQAAQVKGLLHQLGVVSELVFIHSEGDKDLMTPLYAMGVQGIFTRALDRALLTDQIDIAVHSMKDVPTQLADGVKEAAVLRRGSHLDLLLPRGENVEMGTAVEIPMTVATGSLRRKAQWLHRYPQHKIVNLRGNVNTRLKKLEQSSWFGAIFAAAGLERLNLRPANAVELPWMLPAPAQGVILVVCRERDHWMQEACASLNDEKTALCARVERDFLRTLQGGCTTPISALAEVEEDELFFRGNVLSADGKQKLETERILPVDKADTLGLEAARELLENGARLIIDKISDDVV